MNVQLTQVLSDTGVTGMQIIQAIVAGERNPVTLAQFRDRRCLHSTENIAKALTGNYRDEHVFALKQALEEYWKSVCLLRDRISASLSVFS